MCMCVSFSPFSIEDEISSVILHPGLAASENEQKINKCQVFPKL